MMTWCARPALKVCNCLVLSPLLLVCSHNRILTRLLPTVISDDKKAVSIEWARKWNSELLKEYGNEDRAEENTFN